MIDEKDREIWVGENRFYLGEDNVIHVTAVGEADEKMPIGLKEAFDKMENVFEGKVNLLVDLNKAGKPSPGVRKAGQEILEDERIGKVALFGLQPVARVIASFVMGVSRKRDLRFFKTKEQALAWLKE